jgi:3-hydroxybutyryl-CoA dehydrogenase
MKLVEVVSTIATAPDVAATAHAVSLALGKHPVSCADRAGFIVNALLFPYLNDAVTLLESGAHDLDTIDNAIKEQAGFPMGPFQLLDVVGNDVSLAIQQELYAEFKEPGFAPAPMLERLVAEGHLGRKTGKGFHDYS